MVATSQSYVVNIMNSWGKDIGSSNWFMFGIFRRRIQRKGSAKAQEFIGKYHFLYIFYILLRAKVFMVVQYKWNLFIHYYHYFYFIIACETWNVICLEKIIVSIRRISILFLIHSLKYLTADISHELWSDGNLSISSLSLAISYAKLFFSLDFNTWRQNRLRININFSSASTAISTSTSRNNHPHPQ